MANLPPAPDSGVSAFKAIAGFCSSEQAEDPGLCLLLVVYARLGFFESKLLSIMKMWEASMVFIFSAAGSANTTYLALSQAVLDGGMLLVWE